jgi:hypothetical protein
MAGIISRLKSHEHGRVSRLANPLFLCSARVSIALDSGYSDGLFMISQATDSMIDIE